MKVAIDATPLTLTSGGIARYTAELSRALAVAFPDDEFVLTSDQTATLPYPAPANLRLGGSPANVWERRWWLWGVQREMMRQEADVFHGTHFAVPWMPLRPSVATLHDLSPWMDGTWHCDSSFARRSGLFSAGLGAATMIVTPREAVRRQAIDFFRLHPAKVVATPLAAAAAFRPTVNAPDASPYFLFVGTLEPRKNLVMLVEAWRDVRKRHSIDLVLVGRRREDAPDLPPEPGLRVTGELPDERLPGLYAGALAFAYPSFYEGFGLPVLEAMQCGAAVIASRDPAIHEVAGDAAQLLDPRDTRAWIGALEAIATGAEEAARWRARSTGRARLFSWERTARLTREVYAEAIRREGR